MKNITLCLSLTAMSVAAVAEQPVPENILKKSNAIERYYLKASQNSDANKQMHLKQINDTIEKLKIAKAQLNGKVITPQTPLVQHELRIEEGEYGGRYPNGVIGDNSGDYVVLNHEGTVIGAYDQRISSWFNVAEVYFKGHTFHYHLYAGGNDNSNMWAYYTSKNCTGVVYMANEQYAVAAKNGYVYIADEARLETVTYNSRSKRGQCIATVPNAYQNSPETVNLFVGLKTNLKFSAREFSLGTY
ncbi:MAG: hypothetical protein ABJL54_16090 [Halioglobus sp.]